LAPAGSPAALDAVLQAGADAVYLAGKRFGMRQHAAWLNFSDDQLADAVSLAHQAAKRVYITVNNLMTPREIDLLGPHLRFLAELRPDALIVQDLGVIELVRDMGLEIPLHASSMMNVHDSETALVLAGLGVTRIIVSRDITLAEAAGIQRRSGVPCEIFLHGDMCISHSGQCLTSGILTGESANRGKCLKPCRWALTLIDLESGRPMPNPHDGDYLLARKDLCLFEQIPALVESGIAAVKIEGRARKPEYLHSIVDLYRTALDRYTADPAGFTATAQELERLHRSRIRDLTTGLTWGDPGSKSIGYSGRREPRFFSICAEQAPLTEPLPPSATASEIPPCARPALAVHCSDWEAARSAAQAGADRIILASSCFEPAGRLEQVEKLFRHAAGRELTLGIAVDRIVYDDERPALIRLIRQCAGAGVGFALVGATGLGAAVTDELRQRGSCDSFEIQADTALNVLNAGAIRQLAKLGFARVTASLEATLGQTREIIARSDLPVECVVHGALEGMLSEHCMIRASLGPGRRRGSCRDLCTDRRYALRDALGQQHPVIVDRHCRNHVLLPLDLCALPFVPELCAAGAASLRIEARRESAKLVEVVTRCYRLAVDAAAGGRQIDWAGEPLWDELKAESPRGLSPGSYANRSQDVSLPLTALPTNELIRHTGTAAAACVEQGA
jgi:putative protease